MQVINIMAKNKLQLIATLPCIKIKSLLRLVEAHDEFLHIPLTREEDGVGICTGAALTGTRAAMIIQSSGIGNLINALVTLPMLYELPIPILVSWRGVYKEQVDAQRLFGNLLPKFLRALEIPYNTITDANELARGVDAGIKTAFEANTPYVMLISPEVWEGSQVDVRNKVEFPERTPLYDVKYKRQYRPPTLTRFDAFRALKYFLQEKLVVVNLGIPAQELYAVVDQPSNFYMNGSFGLTISIALGIALTAPHHEEVIAIDGDGSILMNPNALCMVGVHKPKNLTIIVVDNGTYGSTGDQITPAYNNVDLELLARTFGVECTAKVYTARELLVAVEKLGSEPGPRFIHTIVKPYNADVSSIPFTPTEIKTRLMGFIMRNRKL